MSNNYLIYKSNSYSTSFYNSDSGVSYLGDNITNISSFTSDGSTFNYGLGLIYHGNFYGRSSYEIFKSENGIGSPTYYMNLGATVAGGQFLDYVNGFLINYNAKKYLDGNSVKTLTAPIKSKIFYDSINNVYFQIDINNVYQFDSLDAATYRTYALPTVYNYNQVRFNTDNNTYEIIEENGVPKLYNYSLSNLQGMVQISGNEVWVSTSGLMNGVQPNIIIDSSGNTKVVYNRDIFPYGEDGRQQLTNYYFRYINNYFPSINKGILISDNKIIIGLDLPTVVLGGSNTRVIDIPSGVSLGTYRTIIDDFVNEKILIGSNTTGGILILDYDGNVISYEIKDSSIESTNYNVKAVYNIYKEVKLNINGNGNFTYTHNGKRNPYENTLNLCVNNNEILTLNFNPDNNYIITSLTSNLGTVDLDNYTITYNNALSYMEDEINITTEFAIEAESGWYNLSGIARDLRDDLDEPLEININGKVYASNGNNYGLFEFNKIILDGYDYNYVGDFGDYMPIDIFTLDESQAVTTSAIQSAFLGNKTTKVNVINLRFNLSENINYTLVNSLGIAKNGTIFAQDGEIARLRINSIYWVIDRITFEATEGVNVFGGINVSYATNLEGEISITINGTQKSNSLTLNLYHNNSDDKVLNKSLELIATVKGNFKSIVDIDEPVIDIRYDGLLNASYVYLEELKNYYFVNRHEQINYNTWRLYLIKDSLMSNRDKIISLNAYILRSTNYYDESLNDNLIPLKNNLTINEIEFDNDKFHTNVQEIEWHKVLVMASDNTFYGSSSDGIKGSVSPSTGNGVLPDVFDVRNDLSGIEIYVLNSGSSITNRLLKWINSNEDLKSRFIGLYDYPFNLLNIPDYNDGGIVKCGIFYKNFTYRKEVSLHGFEEINFYEDGEIPQNPWIVKVLYTNRLILNNFKMEKENNFLNINGKYELFIPYVGWFPINFNQYNNNLIEISYIFDLEKGSSSVILCDLTNNKLLYTSETQVGISIGTTFNNTTEIENKRRQINSNMLLGWLGGTIATIGGIASSNPLMTIGGISSIIGTTANSVVQSENLYTTAYASINNGVTGLYLPNKVRLRTSIQEFDVDIDDFAEKFGRIYCKNRVLGTIRGFVSATGIKLDNFGEISKKEKDEIIRLIENGIYTH